MTSGADEKALTVADDHGISELESLVAGVTVTTDAELLLDREVETVWDNNVTLLK